MVMLENCTHPNPIQTSAGHFCLLCGHLLDNSVPPPPAKPTAVAIEPIAAPQISKVHVAVKSASTPLLNHSSAPIHEASY